MPTPPPKPRLPVRDIYAETAQNLRQPNKTLQRAVPTVPGGGDAQPQAPKQTRSYTYIAGAGPTRQLLVTDSWSRVRLTLRSAGPVAVGTLTALEPITSGKGILLQTDEPYETMLPGGTRLYIAAGAVNRVNVTIEPIPWMEQIAGQLEQLRQAVRIGAETIVRGFQALLQRR